MVCLRLIIASMQSLNFIKEEGAFIPDVKRLWWEQKKAGRHKKNAEFAPLDQVVKATNFVVINTELSQRDKILIYGAIQEALERKDKVIIPLCYFNEERFTLL